MNGCVSLENHICPYQFRKTYMSTISERTPYFLRVFVYQWERGYASNNTYGERVKKHLAKGGSLKLSFLS